MFSNTPAIDYDHQFGSWIKGTPYVWLPGQTLESSKRFYLVHGNAAAVFDEQNQIADPQWISHEIFCNRISTQETFSFWPLTGLVDRNFNLMWCYPIAAEAAINNTPGTGLNNTQLHFPHVVGMQLRMEGIPMMQLKIDGFGKLFKDQIAVLIGTDYQPIRQETLVPWEFGNTFASQGGIRCEISHREKGAKGAKQGWRNLQELAEKRRLKGWEITRIHRDALQGKRGWRYDGRWTSCTLAHAEIMYEQVIGERPRYILRDPRSKGHPSPKVEQSSMFKMQKADGSWYAIVVKPGEAVPNGAHTLSGHPVPKTAPQGSLAQLKAQVTAAQIHNNPLNALCMVEALEQQVARMQISGTPKPQPQPQIVVKVERPQKPANLGFLEGLMWEVENTPRPKYIPEPVNPPRAPYKQRRPRPQPKAVNNPPPSFPQVAGKVASKVVATVSWDEDDEMDDVAQLIADVTEYTEEYDEEAEHDGYYD